MSSALAIASVTQVLKDLLNNGLIDHDITGIVNGNVKVTALPPDLVTTSNDEPAQLNIFMVHVSPNTGWVNQHYPSRNYSGERITNPPLALDLHYLLTAWCSNELHSEILLGYGMQLMHENPVLTREAIRKSLLLPGGISTAGLPLNLQSLSGSGLEKQVEMVKIIPESLTMEEMARIWSALQTKYRPSAAYQVSVVLIESEIPTQPVLPVQERHIQVRPEVLPESETTGI